jgi:hypothetical protein
MWFLEVISDFMAVVQAWLSSDAPDALSAILGMILELLLG